MKKHLAALVGLAVLAGAPAFAADQHQGMTHTGDYCTKHCRATDIRKQLDALNAEIKKDKAAGKMPGEKMIIQQNKAKEMREHLAKHDKEFADLRAELEKIESQLQ